MSTAIAQRDEALAELDALNARIETINAKELLSFLESDFPVGPRVLDGPLLESGYDPRVVPSSEYPGYGTGFFKAEYSYQPTRKDDRTAGNYRPIYETEQDLDWIRAIGRYIGNESPSGLNVLSNLTNYTIGTGYQYEPTIIDNQNAPEGLIPAVKKWLTEFRDDNEMAALERELHWSSREDGEIMARVLGFNHGRARVSVIEPEHLVRPANTRQLEDWLDCEYVSQWAFGVHCREDQPEFPLGYHVCRNNSGSDWEYVKAGEVVHYKRNVRRGAARGVSDFYPVWRFWERAEKLLRNTVVGGAIQAAIAYVRQMSGPNATLDNASSIRTSSSTRSYLGNRGDGSSVTKYQETKDPGSIITIGNGMEYVSGPLGSERADNFIAMTQAGLRYVGIRWQLPEYMVSGDASNANYSSTLVAGSPFIKAREADQSDYKAVFRLIHWKALRIAFDAGRFAQFGLDWAAFERLVDIEITPPEVETRDKVAESSSQISLVTSGLKTVKTARAELGMDHDTEETNAKEAGGGASTIQLSGIQITTAKDVLRDVALGATAPDAGLELLRSLGIQDTSARRMLAATVEFKPRVVLDAQGNVTDAAGGVGPAPGDGATSPAPSPDAHGVALKGMSRMDHKRTIATALDIADRLNDGALKREQAVVLLQNLGLSAEDAETMLGEIDATVGPKGETVESVTLSPALRGIAAALLEGETPEGVVHVLEELANA